MSVKISNCRNLHRSLFLPQQQSREIAVSLVFPNLIYSTYPLLYSIFTKMHAHLGLQLPQDNASGLTASPQVNPAQPASLGNAALVNPSQTQVLSQLSTNASQAMLGNVGNTHPLTANSGNSAPAPVHQGIPAAPAPSSAAPTITLAPPGLQPGCLSQSQEQGITMDFQHLLFSLQFVVDAFKQVAGQKSSKTAFEDLVPGFKADPLDLHESFFLCFISPSFLSHHWSVCAGPSSVGPHSVLPSEFQVASVCLYSTHGLGCCLSHPIHCLSLLSWSDSDF